MEVIRKRINYSAGFLTFHWSVLRICIAALNYMAYWTAFADRFVSTTTRIKIPVFFTARIVQRLIL